MSSAAGPSIATSGLVLDIDMSNTQKSWKGKPTTNYVDPKWISWSVDGSGQATIGTRTIVSLYDCIITDTVANTRQNIFVLGLSASTAYTFSVKFKKISGAPTLRFQLQSYNGGTFISAAFPTTVELGLTDIDGWQTASYTYTTAVGADRVSWFMQDGNDYTTYTHSFELKEPQAELGSFATPFIAGTRSSTQAIVDLTNIDTLTVSNLTYAADNTFSFNGSNSYIQSSITGSFPQISFDFWSFFDDPALNMYSREESILGDWNNGRIHFGTRWGGAGMHWNVNSIWEETSNTNLKYGWNHYSLVWNHNTSEKKVYINSILSSSSTTNGNIVLGDFKIGVATALGYYYRGKISGFSIYNRALSAAEVKQNFNATRSRYGL